MPKFEVKVKEKLIPDAKPFTVQVSSGRIHTQADAEKHVTEAHAARLTVVPLEEAAPKEEVAAQ